MLGYCFVVDFDVTVVPWFMLIYFSVTYLHDLLCMVCSLYSTRTNSLGFDFPNGQWQIRVWAFGFHLVLFPCVGCDPEGSMFWLLVQIMRFHLHFEPRILFSRKIYLWEKHKRLLFYLQQQCGRNKSLLKRMNNITIHPLTISLEEHPNILQLTSLRSKITAVVSVAYSIMQRLPLEFL